MNAFKTIDWKDVIKRAAKTFVQAFLSYITIDGLFGLDDASMLKRFALTTGISALAAGISAVWNLIMEIISEKASEAIDEMGDSEAEDEGSENIVNV